VIVIVHPTLIIEGDQHTTKPRSEVDEESTVYRGYTNPNVQSRSFKILQESLNYSEAPQGNNKHG
jgi:hypothetical protein